MDLSDRIVTIKEGDTLALGSHTLSFIAAPMVHWPEVMMNYEASEKVLFAADGFGKFGVRGAGMHSTVKRNSCTAYAEQPLRLTVLCMAFPFFPQIPRCYQLWQLF